MKKALLLSLLLAVFTAAGFAQTGKYWSASYANPGTIATDKAVARLAFPKVFKLFSLDIEPLRQQLFSIVDQPGKSTIITLPNANGGLERFEVYEASNFEPALQARFPQIRAYSGRGIDDKYSMLKLSISPQGIQTMTFRTDKENEFIEAGENLPVHREPVDSTFYEPNIIIAPKHEAMRPDGPEKYGVKRDDLSCETRCGRNVVYSWAEAKKTAHPLMKDGYKFIFHTPKFRHGSHTTPVDVDMIAVLFGPFGDLYRRDKRKPFVTEGYVDINPTDAREIGVQDGDYVWIDADPEDRPFRGWKENKKDYEIARLLCRARYYPGTPRGVTRMWFNMYTATPGSVQGSKERADGLAKNPRTNYQAMFRSGSHQSATRGWLKPTLMTDSLVRKGTFGQGIGKGFMPDVHCPTGAPRESFVKITKAEPGGIEGHELWRPAEIGIRPKYESEAMQKYLAGGFVSE